MTVVLDGIVCNNTCVGFADGDNTLDFLNLWGGGQISGPFELVISNHYDLTVNSHTLSFGFNDPHFSISFNDPLLVSFSPGAFMFQATGLPNIYGFALPETEFFCPTPGVPEPATWALMLFGLAVMLLVKRKQNKFA